MEQRTVCAPVSPAPVNQAWPHETEPAPTMAPVAIHRAENHFALFRGTRISVERIDEFLGRGREVASGAVLIVTDGRR